MISEKLLTNLLLYAPSLNGFSRYVETVVPWLPGLRLVLRDSPADCVCNQGDALPTGQPESRTLRTLQNLTLAQHGLPVKNIVSQLRNRIDVIYSPFTDYLFACGDLPQIITCHDLTPLFHGGSNRSRLRYRYWTPIHLRRARQVIAISSFVAGQLVDIGISAKKISVIPNGVSIERDPVLAPKSHDWLVIARHDANKNIMLAIKAFNIFLRRRSDWPGSLFIVGKDGRETGLLLRLINELDIGDRVKLITRVSNQELVTLVRSSFALISTSLMEGFNYPVMEAKAEGIPTIISDIPVHREFHNDSSLIFDIDTDGDCLACRMSELAVGDENWKAISALGLTCASRLNTSTQVSSIRALINSVAR